MFLKSLKIEVDSSNEDLIKKRNIFDLNYSYTKDLTALNKTKSSISSLSTEIGALTFRRGLICQSQTDLEKESSNIDSAQVADLYKTAKTLIPNIQKSFEETLSFHNQMVQEKIRYITIELPELNAKIAAKNEQLATLLEQEICLNVKTG